MRGRCLGTAGSHRTCISSPSNSKAGFEGGGGRAPAWKAPEKVGNGVVGCGWAPWSTPANEKLCQPLRRKADSRGGAARHART